ncbi:hypothetical protein BJX64DRAFT_168721 [Aspergillus heterothallicus]
MCPLDIVTLVMEGWAKHRRLRNRCSLPFFDDKSTRILVFSLLLSGIVLTLLSACRTICNGDQQELDHVAAKITCPPRIPTLSSQSRTPCQCHPKLQALRSASVSDPHTQSSSRLSLWPLIQIRLYS